MNADAVRRIIREADDHQRCAREADLARAKIRLSEKPVMKRGLLGIRKTNDADLVIAFTADETFAVYEALAVVRDAHVAAVKRLEAQIQTRDAQ